MVTGVETAGLVLAAFPIIANSLGSYIAGASLLSRWRNQKKHGRELKTFQRQLETQKVIYLNTLEDLLGSIVYSDADKSLLINNPGGPAWTSVDYEARLRERLGQSYQAYIATMTDLFDSMTFLKEKMNLHRLDMLSKRPESIIKKELQNFKMVLPGSTYERRLAEIRSANRDLLDLTRQTRYHGFLRNKKRTTAKTIDHLIRLRHSARSLHQLLIRNELWKCKSSHNINIRLEPSDDLHSVLGCKSRFRMLISCEVRPQSGTSQTQAEGVLIRRWRDVEIEPSEHIIDERDHVAGARSIFFPTSAGNAPREPGTIGPKTPEKWNNRLVKRKKNKKVRFAQSQPDSGTAAAATSSMPSFKPITDICSAVQPLPFASRKCLGFLVGESTATIFQQHDVFVVGGHDAPSNENLLSLDSILASGNQGDKQAAPQKFSFSRRDRLFIAAALASSAVQFDGSWLKRFWRSRDVFFLQRDWPAAETKHPYFAWKVLAGENRTEEEPLAPLSPKPIDSIHKEILFPLGLTLTELSLGRTWADMESVNDVKSKEATANLEERLRLVYDESGLQYGDVVRSCLFWRIDSRGKGFEDDEYLQSVFEQIVSPLVENWKDFEGRCAW